MFYKIIIFIFFLILSYFAFYCMDEQLSNVETMQISTSTFVSTTTLSVHRETSIITSTSLSSTSAVSTSISSEVVQETNATSSTLTSTSLSFTIQSTSASFCQNGYLINLNAFVDENLKEFVMALCDVERELYCFPNNVPAFIPNMRIYKSIQLLEGMEQISPSEFLYVNLYGNLITDVHALTNFNISSLDMRNNQIKDISPFATLKNIKHLYLNENPIETIGNLEKLEKLLTLGITNGKINDLTTIEKITSLTRLSLSRNQIVDLLPLKNLTQLGTLYIGGNQITDILPLSTLIHLNELALDNNQIVDVPPLSGLLSLYELTLSYNQIVNVSPLSGLPVVCQLDLSYNQIVDASPLGTLPLYYLNLEGNDTLDCSTVENLNMVDEAVWNEDDQTYEYYSPVIKLPDHCK